MDEKALTAAVAGRAAMAKEEAADLIRATLEGLGDQLSGGEVRELALELPDGLARSLPQHEHGSHPVPLTDFVGSLSRRTGLNQAEVTRGIRAILTTMGRTTQGPALRHALSQLPAEYRRLATA